MKTLSFKDGAMIFREGDVSHCAFLVVTGSVNVHLPNGRVKNLGAGEIFGEMGLIDNRPRSATVTAGEDSVLATYSEAELLDAIKTHPDDAIAFIRALIGRLREANEVPRAGRIEFSLFQVDDFSA
jgi:CRP/FNR family cyclic AMP-dependent transcriptional regulator